MNPSLTKKVGLAALIMMASVLLSRVIGLLRNMVIGYIGGASGAVDAYQIAFVIPEILNHIVASGFLSVTFIPIFSGYLVQDKESEGWRVFSLIFTAFGVLLLVLIGIAFIFAPQLIAITAPGLRDSTQIASAVRMTRIILPAQFFFFSGGMLMAVQFAKEQFARPALAPLIYNLGIILGGILLSRWLGMEGFSWGVLAGAFAGNFLMQYIGAKRAGMQFRLIFDLRHPDLKKYVLLTLPLMLGLTATFSTEFFYRFFGSYLPPGGVATLDYALRVMLVLVGMFGQASGVASFPFLARLIAEGKLSEMNRLLNDTLRRYIALVIPFSALLIVLRYEVIRLLFQRGKFTALATAQTSEVLMFLLIGAFAFAGQTVVVRGYYAMQNTLFPTIFSTLAVLASLPLYWYGLQLIGIKGVALAMSASAIIQTTLLYALWGRRTNNEGRGEVYRFFAKIILLSAIVCLLLLWFKTRLLQGIDHATPVGSLLICLILGTVFVIAFIGMGYIFRVDEIVGMIDRFAKKLRIN
ncbi:MAG: murein biosynthesis integral membrane protein MurJ [candidate division KSB1 bacterium]|nr:murein biosynthesis integral membrane protein MurJ [candidate division KSB1 bacterium]MDZ7305145.1 murein biosynthesis integral membrane protein MurJ [candidate division KSB1 bacterium]MDZ7314229.1 murein biosynthesis integral membrane protein MurJ [candidate division KSB1 bacterium]